MFTVALCEKLLIRALPKYNRICSVNRKDVEVKQGGPFDYVLVKSDKTDDLKKGDTPPKESCCTKKKKAVI